MARMNLMPPAASAGKNLTVVTPKDSAISMSEGLAQPGRIGMPFVTQYSTTFGLSPGDTM